MKVTIYFHECEHQGDMQNYLGELMECNAKIVTDSLDYEAETGTIEIEVEHYGEFLGRFEDTDAYEFSSLCS